MCRVSQLVKFLVRDIKALGFATAECVGALYRANFSTLPLYVYTTISMIDDLKADNKGQKDNEGSSF